VLVTNGGEGQNRSALAAMQALALAGFEPVATVSGRDSLAASSRHCRAAVPVPPVTELEYAEAVQAELEARSYVALMPASDAALLALDLAGAPLVDKARLPELARGAGLEVPPGRTFSSTAELAHHAEELDYPVVAKAALKTSWRPRRDAWSARRTSWLCARSTGTGRSSSSPSSTPPCTRCPA
jgi:biotin carboxylase